MKNRFQARTAWNSESAEMHIAGPKIGFREIHDAIRDQDSFNAQELTLLIALATDKLNGLYQRNAMARFEAFVGKGRSSEN
jgi:hypothetical protein